MISSKVQLRRTLFQKKIDKILDEVYFDVQGFTPGFNTLDEAYLARVLTKLAIGSATVWWSLLEMKDFIRLYKRSKLNG